MSAELYDAEMAGALARPAIDVLPTNTRKGKSEEHLLAAPSDAAIEAAPEAAPEHAVSSDDAVEVPTDLPEPSTPVEVAAAAESPAPRKVFGMALTRSRKPKASTELAADDVAVEEPVDTDPAPEWATEAVEAEAAVPVAVGTDTVAEEVAGATVDAPAAEVVALAPSMPDHTDEVRAMRALLEASEQVRQAAEARTAAAEAQLRTVTNTVQEWQIRHREAEATITELAASLAGAESRMAELHQRVSAVEAERDELTSQLDAATSPATS